MGFKSASPKRCVIYPDSTCNTAKIPAVMRGTPSRTHTHTHSHTHTHTHAAALPDPGSFPLPVVLINSQAAVSAPVEPRRGLLLVALMLRWTPRWAEACAGLGALLFCDVITLPPPLPPPADGATARSERLDPERLPSESSWKRN